MEYFQSAGASSAAPSSVARTAALTPEEKAAVPSEIGAAASTPAQMAKARSAALAEGTRFVYTGHVTGTWVHVRAPGGLSRGWLRRRAVRAAR